MGHQRLGGVLPRKEAYSVFTNPLYLFILLKDL